MAVKVRSSKGFSLIELIIVIAILGIVSAIAAPNFNKYRQNTNLKEAARDLSSDISLYRQRAVAENIRYQIVFNQAANSYTIHSLNPAVPDVTKRPSASGNVIISNSPAPSFTGGVPIITIQPRGTMSGGTVTLQHTGRGSTATITLVQFTGRVPRIAYNLL
jgi:prepilin-type N-terminal cleavage/methylation domain-containing protein